MNETTVPKKLQIGIPWRMLHSPLPSEAVKTARAIAEELCSHDDLGLSAISDPYFSGMDFLFESVGLREWLAKHPLIPQDSRLGKARSLFQRPFQATKSYARRFKAPLKKLAEWLGLDRMAQRLYRRHIGAARKFAPILGSAARAQIRSIRDFDAILSFECHDEIWDWPTENFSCKLAGFYHDIPANIRDEIDRTPAEYYRAMGRMANKADTIFCTSQSAQRDLAAFFPRATGKVRVAHLGHERELFLHGASLPGRGIPNGFQVSAGKVLAMIGAGEERKNQKNVLRACAHLAATVPDQRMTLLVIGDTAASAEFRERSNNAHPHVQICYTGYVSNTELGSVLRQCDAFLYPSLWEGSGTPILNAMSAGIPVVCSNQSSMPEVAGKWGFYCDPFDPTSIADAIGRALALDGRERSTWIEGAREWAGGFTWQRTGDELRRALHELLAANPLQNHSLSDATTWRAA